VCTIAMEHHCLITSAYVIIPAVNHASLQAGQYS